MKIASAIIGIIASLLSLALAIFTSFFGAVDDAIRGSSQIATMGVIGIFASLLTLVLSAVIFAKPKQSGILLIGTSIGAIIGGGTFVAIAMFLNLIAGVMAYIQGIKDADHAKKSIIVWSISVLLAIILMASALGSGKTTKTTSEDVVNLDNAPISNIMPNGELADAFVTGSKYTDLQREKIEDSIKGKIVEWTLPVYEVEKNGDIYRIQTSSKGEFLSAGSEKTIGAFVRIKARNKEEASFIENLKTDDEITFRGQIKGFSMRNVQIEPAILILSPTSSVGPNEVQSSSSTQLNTSESSQKATTESLASLWKGSLEGDGEMKIEKRGEDYGVSISVNTEGCTGGIDGTAKLIGNELKLTVIEAGETCNISIKLNGNSADLTEDGCSLYHGMGCGFTGTLKKVN